MKIYIFITVLFFSASVSAETLSTENYLVTVNTSCEEGVVVCDKATYHGRSKKSGNEIKLNGKTIHTTCKDGVTPCRFLGYEFKNGDITYSVYESGTLRVTQGKSKVLLEEEGAWEWE